MKINKFLGLGIFVVLSVFMLGMVSAATTLVAPASTTNHTGTIALVNCTTAVANALNATIWYNATGVSDTALVTIVNTSVSQLIFSATSTSVSALTDVDDYAFWCAVRGDTSENSTTKTSITIDNTDPVVSLSVDLSGESQSFGRLIEYSCTTTDAIDSSPTETFTVTHPSGDDTSSTSLTLQSTKLQFLDTDYAGDYVFSCDSTDYTGNSPSASTATVTIGSAGYAQKVGGNSGNNNTWIFIVFGGLAIWYFTKKK